MDTNKSLVTMADEKAMLFMRMDPGAKEFSASHFELIGKQAVFGFRVKREIMLSQRTDRDQFLRAVRMVTSDPEERKGYIKATMPKLIET